MGKMLYVAAQYKNREWAIQVMNQLIAAGHHVTSRWLIAETQENALAALMDEEDVRMATDGLVLLAEPDGSLVKGGKHVETGMALALRRTVWVVGQRENVFHHHPLVRVVPDVEALLKDLGKATPTVRFDINDTCETGHVAFHTLGK